MTFPATPGTKPKSSAFTPLKRSKHSGSRPARSAAGLPKDISNRLEKDLTEQGSTPTLTCYDTLNRAGGDPATVFEYTDASRGPMPAHGVDLRNSGANRHGIPLRGGGKRPKQCCWPRCTMSVGSFPNVPLCNTHIEIAVKVYNKVYDDLEAERTADYRAWQERVKAAEAEQRAKDARIYYVKVGGHIKIGWTTQLEQRMRQYPPNAELLAVEPGTRQQEQQLHKRFAVHRSHGREWYPLVPVLLDHIDHVVREHGKLEDVAFGAKPVKTPQSRDKQSVQIRSRTGRRHRNASQFS